MKYLLILILFLPVSVFGQGWGWVRGETGSSSEGYCVTTDKWGHIYEAGYSFGSDSFVFGQDTSFYSLPIVKYDSSGNILWVRGIVTTAAPISITTDVFGNLYIYGLNFNSSITIGNYTFFNDGYLDTLSQYFLAKYDSAGNLIWANTVGNAGTRFNADPYSYLEIYYIWINNLGGIATDGSGNVYVTGDFDNNPTIGRYNLNNTGRSDIFLVKYDSAGNVDWARGMHGSNNDFSTGITISPENQLYIAGLSFSTDLSFGGPDTLSADYNMFVCRFDTNGHEIWAKKDHDQNTVFLSNDLISVCGIATDKAGGVYVTGMYYILVFGIDTLYGNGNGNENGYLVKFDSTGNRLWAKKMVGDSSAGAFGVVTDACDNVWVTGSLHSNLTIDNTVIHLNPVHIDDIFLAGFSSVGHVLATATLASGGDDFCGVSADPAGNIYVTGDYYGSFVLPTGDTLIADIENMYLAKYTHILGTDTVGLRQVVCLDDSISLRAPSGYTYYAWNNGSTEPAITVYATGINIVTGTGLCLYTKDTFDVVNISPADSSFLGSDSAFCPYTSVVLFAPPGYTSYAWSNGSSDSAITVNSSGIFRLLSEAGSGCDLMVNIDTFSVVEKAANLPFTLGSDTFACTSFLLHVPGNGPVYTWQDSSTGSTLNVTKSGAYFCTGIEEGCVYAAHVAVTIPEMTQDLRDTSICSELLRAFEVTANVPAGGECQWSTGSATATLTLTQPGVYWVKVTDSVCSVTDTMTLQSGTCKVVIHDVITPNGDGINDTWTIEDIDKYPGNSVRVFDKWGTEVYGKSNYNNDWAGKDMNGHELPDGTYFYLVKFDAISLAPGEKNEYTGAVLIKR